MKEFREDVHITADPPSTSSGLPERSTHRLRIDSWERSNRGNGRAGDAIALHWMRPDAKAFIGWWDTTDPDNPVCKAWIGAHDEANNPAAAPHRHFSVEVTDSTGQMQTRFAIPYDQDHSNITTSKSDFTVQSGTLRLPRNSQLEFAEDKQGSRGSRWQMRMVSSQNLELLYFEAGSSKPRHVATMNSKNGNLEIETLGANDLILKDRATGVPTRLYVENGKLCLEKI